MQESSLETLDEYGAATMIRYLSWAFTRSRMKSLEMKVAGEKLQQVDRVGCLMTGMIFWCRNSRPGFLSL